MRTYSLPLSLKLVEDGVIDLNRAIMLLSAQPAAIIGVERGTLQAGAVADIALVDPQAEWTFSVAELHSKSKNTPFEGWAMKGAVIKTILAGKVVYEKS